MWISNAYAQGMDAATNGLASMLPIIVLFTVLWFAMIRPQIKRQRDLKAMLEVLAKGDEIITSGGLLARVLRISEHYVVVELGQNLEVPLQKSAITAVLPKGTLKAL